MISIICDFCKCETYPLVTKVFTSNVGVILCIHCLLRANNILRNDESRPRIRNLKAVERKAAKCLYLEAHLEHERKVNEN